MIPDNFIFRAFVHQHAVPCYFLDIGSEGCTQYFSPSYRDCRLLSCTIGKVAPQLDACCLYVFCIKLDSIQKAL